MLAPWKKSYDQPRQHSKKQRHYFANNGPSSQSYGFSSSRVWMWELDHKGSWVPKSWWFCTVVLEKTLESSLDWKEIKPINPKGNQSWISIGRTDAEAEAPIFGHLMWRANSLDKTVMLGKNEGRKRRGWQRVRWLDDISDINGHEFERAPGVDDEQGSLVCCIPWGLKELDITEWLNNNTLHF